MTIPVLPIVEAQAVTRDFPMGVGVMQVLRGIDLMIRPGEIVVLQGRSGSGKSTLFQILAGLDEPTTGQVQIKGTLLASLSEAKRAQLRRTTLGLLFQQAYLFPYLTAQENVLVAWRLLAEPLAHGEVAAQLALEQVGLTDRTRHRAYELSGGEQVRVALARALVHHPALLMADEPTANLDTATSQHLLDLLRDLARVQEMGMFIVTHDAAVVAIADHKLTIQDGQLMRSTV
jgi:ABC-type lipoprotein export system ATPase subunit